MDSDELSFFTSFYHTPPLWQGSYDGLEQFNLPALHLKTLDFPSIPPNLRLGHRIEFIFQQLLSHSDRYRILIHNLPIYQNKISIGEIDFIVQDADNKSLMHIELTYKFYIVTGDNRTIHHQLIGPNKRDSFIYKKERIKQHQLPLLYRPESVAALRAFHIDVGKLEQKLCFKSQLFMPYNDRNMDLGPFNADCIVGSWIARHHFTSDAFGSLTYYLPPKPEWPLTPRYNVDWRTYGAVLDEIEGLLKQDRAPLVWAKNGLGALQKMFILS